MLFYRNSKEKSSKKNTAELHKTQKTNNKNKMTSSLQSMHIRKIHVIPPKLQKICSGRRAASGTFKKGSLTVEAAWVLPLFLMACLALFYMFDLYGVYVKESMELKEKAEKMAMHAYEADLSESLYPDGYITLTKLVKYRLPFTPAPIPAINIPCYARVHAWIGYTGNSGDEVSISKSEDMVYVSDFESVYHTSSSCTHLDLTIKQESLQSAVSMLNHDGSHYEPCEKCIGSGTAHGIVYVSDRGTAYHNSLSCSGLTRNVHLVKKDEYQNLTCCERCEKAN